MDGENTLLNSPICSQSTDGTQMPYIYSIFQNILHNPSISLAPEGRGET